MTKLISIGEAATLVGVCTKTLKRWEAAGKVTSYKTPGGTRRYNPEVLKREVFDHGNKAHFKQSGISD